MTKFIAHTIETAPTRSRALLEGVKQALGFVPNLYGVFAESPAALQGALAIWDAVVSLARSDTFFELKRGRR